MECYFSFYSIGVKFLPRLPCGMRSLFLWGSSGRWYWGFEENKRSVLVRRLCGGPAVRWAGLSASSVADLPPFSHSSLLNRELERVLAYKYTTPPAEVLGEGKVCHVVTWFHNHIPNFRPPRLWSPQHMITAVKSTAL
jgi:hypothetical protein